MEINDAVKTKINKMIFERNISINKLAKQSDLMQSTVDSILNGRSKNPTIGTIARICKGLNISVYEFFNDELFDNKKK